MRSRILVSANDLWITSEVSATADDLMNTLEISASPDDLLNTSEISAPTDDLLTTGDIKNSPDTYPKAAIVVELLAMSTVSDSELASRILRRTMKT